MKKEELKKKSRDSKRTGERGEKIEREIGEWEKRRRKESGMERVGKERRGGEKGENKNTLITLHIFIKMKEQRWKRGRSTS